MNKKSHIVPEARSAAIEIQKLIVKNVAVSIYDPIVVKPAV